MERNSPDLLSVQKDDHFSELRSSRRVKRQRVVVLDASLKRDHHFPIAARHKDLATSLDGSMIRGLVRSIPVDDLLPRAWLRSDELQVPRRDFVRACWREPLSSNRLR